MNFNIKPGSVIRITGYDAHFWRRIFFPTENCLYTSKTFNIKEFIENSNKKEVNLESCSFIELSLTDSLIYDTLTNNPLFILEVERNKFGLLYLKVLAKDKIEFIRTTINYPNKEVNMFKEL